MEGAQNDQRIFYSVFDGNSSTWSPPTPIAGANTSNQPSLEVSLNRRGSAVWYTVLMTWKGIEGDQRIFYSVFDGNNGTWSPPTPISWCKHQ